MFTFFALFPRKLFHARWIWFAAWMPAILLLPVLLAFMYHAVYRPERLLDIRIQQTLAVALLIGCLYCATGFAALIVNYRRLEDLNERRRVRVLAVGSMVRLIPALAGILIVDLPPFRRAVSPSLSTFIFYSGWVFLPVFPLSFVYAILRHQLFDIRVIIRQGLQYAAARGVLISLIPAAVALLFADLALHRNQTLGAIMEQRGWLYAVLAVAAFLAHYKRQQWMNMLDKRFFRERYNAQQILLEMVEEVRAAGTLDQVAQRTVSHIETALHPEFVALMVREAGAPEYRCLASSPAGAAPRGLMAESKLMAAFRLFAKPLQVSLSESGWLKQQLPHQDTEFLRQSRIDLLVPIALALGTREALLALGVKKSEEPYSSEDQELLLAIANGLALLLERPAAAAPKSGLEECPQCGKCYDSGAGQCSAKGAKLTPSPAPRLLTGRYGLEKQIGRGGMGTVYKALDTSLDRDVAIKLIRDDLITNSEIAERLTTLPTQDTGAGVLVGTPQYMSPEQLKGELPSVSWDVWALSVVAYEALTGAHPFAHGRSIAEVHNAISNGRFVPISDYLPDTSARMCSFFLRVFSLIPAERPQSAQLLCSELASALAEVRSVPA